MTKASAELARHVSDAIHHAHEGRSNLDDQTLAVKGFSTPLMRRIYSNIMTAPVVSRYLEIGCWHGASLCAAATGGAECVGVEDFSQPFGTEDVRSSLVGSITKFANSGANIELLERDYRTLSADEGLGTFDCLMYDGEHSYESQRSALTNLLPFMADSCIYICDDYSWPDVLRGTQDGLNDIARQRKVVKDFAFHVSGNDDPLFHNGLLIAILEKV